jgi:probable rRNA maturation factor
VNWKRTPPGTRELSIHNSSGRQALSPAHVRRLVRFVLSAEQRRLAELSIVFLDDAAMSALHRQWHGDPTPTDILTFDLGDGPSRAPAPAARKEPICGELAIGVDHAARAAADLGTDLRRELMLYVVHGLLHLCGHDDKSPAAFRRMHRREDELLTAFGVGPVFAPGRPATARPSARRGRPAR